MLLRNTELDGRIVDIRLDDKIREIGQHLTAGDGPIRDAHGGAVLPGLYDHHLHFQALAARAQSIDLSVASIDALVAHPGDGWLRGIGYHESSHGALERRILDAWVADRPVRVQHSSGKMWVLNSLACELLDVASASLPGIERDGRGKITGRLFRMDQWVADRLAPLDLDTQGLTQELVRFGITGFTDASFTNASATIDRLALLPFKTWVMGDESLVRGQLKIMLDEDALPDFDESVARITHAHDRDRGVAFHCVTRIEVVFAIAVLEAAGAHALDRLEHGALIAPDLFERIAALGVTVVTQPGFIVDRGDRYLAEVEPADQVDLYRHRSLLDAGIAVAASSDAPYGPVDPWLIMDAATRRTTRSGRVLGRDECVAPRHALCSYLSTPEAPGGAAREVAVGAVADLCVLQQCLTDALSDLGRVEVQMTLVDGNLAYSNDASIS